VGLKRQGWCETVTAIVRFEVEFIPVWYFKFEEGIGRLEERWVRHVGGDGRCETSNRTNMLLDVGRGDGRWGIERSVVVESHD